MPQHELRPDRVIEEGSIFSEPVRIQLVKVLGAYTRVEGVGLRTGKSFQRSLSQADIAKLTLSPEIPSFDGDSRLFRLGLEALRLGLAYEYDPYFALSIARIDPLPHQLEAVYNYFLAQPRIRFLLADDPGAGKTVMAGLLLKELKVRGLIKRILIVTPANLTFQWKREMRDKFREDFKVMDGSALRGAYGSNPWQEHNQLITSIAWVSRIDDANKSLLTSSWDLIIVDEAHKMSASDSQHKTLAYTLGEKLSERTDHLLLMTATPHKGNPEAFRMFLSLLDRDVYGSIESVTKALHARSAPFYLRRTKEALVTFPDPESKQVKRIYTRRHVETIAFDLSDEEVDLYDELTRYVADQAAQAAADADVARGRAVGFTLALLQRRFASSTYALKRSLERMRDRRQVVLDDPEQYRKKQIADLLPDDFDELEEIEQEEILTKLEEYIPPLSPTQLRSDIARLGRLVAMCEKLGHAEAESKLAKLRDTMEQRGVFTDPQMRLLIFTEHKDTLTFLVEKLRSWGLSVTSIYGGMHIGKADQKGTRLYAEHEFKQSCQVMVATEAAGEGINLQFCWFMINYDIPWNPMRLEQRMGRIHRYGQERDCLILNFVSQNTREGRVLTVLFSRLQAIERDLDPQGTGQVFNVLGDILPANQLEHLLREMVLHNQSEDVVKKRIVEDVDIKHFRKIADNALEGLARRDLNLAVLTGNYYEARERRLVPEVVANFFSMSSSVVGLSLSRLRGDTEVFRLGKIPTHLRRIAIEQEGRYGGLAEEYRQITFEKGALTNDPTLEWVTPGHPLFEAVRAYVIEQAESVMRRGAILIDPQRIEPALLDVFRASIEDGAGNTLHERLYVIESSLDGAMSVRQPTLFLDLTPAPVDTIAPQISLPDQDRLEEFLTETALATLLDQEQSQRVRDTKTIREHAETSLNALIHHKTMQIGDLEEQRLSGRNVEGLEGRIAIMNVELDALNTRLETRLRLLEMEAICMIGPVTHIGRACVIPYESQGSGGAAMVRDEEIEKIAIDFVTTFYERDGWHVESVEAENRGFDLIARRSVTTGFEEIQFIEVKGRASVGDIALTPNEYLQAGKLATDYWLAIVYNCASQPELHMINNPSRLLFEPIVKLQHYLLSPKSVRGTN